MKYYHIAKLSVITDRSSALRMGINSISKSSIRASLIERAKNILVSMCESKISIVVGESSKIKNQTRYTREPEFRTDVYIVISELQLTEIYLTGDRDYSQQGSMWYLLSEIDRRLSEVDNFKNCHKTSLGTLATMCQVLSLNRSTSAVVFSHPMTMDQVFQKRFLSKIASYGDQ